jgi:hypothetical protein
MAVHLYTCSVWQFFFSKAWELILYLTTHYAVYTSWLAFTAGIGISQSSKILYATAAAVVELVVAAGVQAAHFCSGSSCGSFKQRPKVRYTVRCCHPRLRTAEAAIASG